MDSNLQWNKLIDYVITTVRQFFFIFKKIREILKNNLSFFLQPVITYGIEIWRGIFNTHLIKLKNILKKIINIS
jgi:hypothetical protein